MDHTQQTTDTTAEGRCVYVGNLQFGLTAEGAEAALRDAKLVNFEKVEIPGKPSPIHRARRGYCFIYFATREAANEALKVLEGVEICGRPINVSLREAKPHSASDEKPQATRLYVGGLGPMLNREENVREIRELFTDFELVAVGKRRASLSPSDNPYVFVKLSTPEEADRARQALDRQSHRGKALNVQQARTASPEDAD